MESHLGKQYQHVYGPARTVKINKNLFRKSNRNDIRVNQSQWYHFIDWSEVGPNQPVQDTCPEPFARGAACPSTQCFMN
jgi:hypothetical protein